MWRLDVLQMRPLSLARRKETHLKYAVEVKIPRSTPMMGLLEPILERVVYEDIPFNLAAVKQRVEDLKLQRRIAELEEQGMGPATGLDPILDFIVTKAMKINKKIFLTSFCSHAFYACWNPRGSWVPGSANDMTNKGRCGRCWQQGS